MERASIVTLLACAWIAGCSRAAREPAPAAASAAPKEQVVHSATVAEGDSLKLPLPPRGRWRVAPRTELDQVVLFVSHILVRHRDAQPSEPPFAPSGWNVQPPPPPRTRAHAFELASQIADEAHQLPHEFRELARRYSEDSATRASGGALGGLQASQLIEADTVLDALATLRAGEISGVVETPYGFHVLRREPTPPEQAIAARRIVLGHADAPWLNEFQRRAGATGQRTRAAAHELAASLLSQLRARPALFAELVARHSEHRDAEQGGDMGTWSNREPSPYRLQLMRLAQMEIGEISEPIETPMGLELVQRSAPLERAQYTIAAIKLAFSPGAPDERPDSLVNMRKKAEAMLAFLATQGAAQFAQFQAQYCCKQHERWSGGRGDLALSAALDAAPVGALLERAFVIENNLVIAKKLAPEPAPALRFELPAPAAPNLEYLVAHVPAQKLSGYVRALAAQLASALSLADEKRDTFEALHVQSAEALQRAEPDARAGVLHGALLTTHDLLGEQDFQRYMALVNADVSRVMMQ